MFVKHYSLYLLINYGAISFFFSDVLSVYYFSHFPQTRRKRRRSARRRRHSIDESKRFRLVKGLYYASTS